MTTAEEVGTCPECGSTDKGTRYSLTPQIMDAVARFCKNDWHNVPPEVNRDEFTEQELTVILALSLGMRHHDIEKHLGMTEDIIQQCRGSISDKAGPDLRDFIRTALNSEMLWRKGKPDPRRP